MCIFLHNPRISGCDFVYQDIDNEVVVIVISAYGHYDDK